jgi:sugar O-acyltransferase (sialic acid O-acetyltransferase NeuD family)
MFKKRLVDKLAPLGSRVKFPNLIHPNVIMGSHINLGVGNIITAGNILTCNIEIASHVMVNLACTVGHDSICENFVVVSPKSAISGNTPLKEGCYLGTGCTVIEKKTIGSWSVVGGAALVNKDVPDNATVVGVPGVVIKTRERGWHLE